MSVNLASKYSDKVDERFYKESQVASMLNNDYDFTGEKTVKVYSIPIAGMNDYNRSGTNRYGDAIDIGRTIQTMTVEKDRAFTFAIDKGDKLQSQMVSDAGKALSRQLREVCVPEYDQYIFQKMVTWATDIGAVSTTVASKSNAFELFLDGIAYLGNHNVPDGNRICYASYKYANFLMQDSNFIKANDTAQNILLRGYVGDCFGVPVVLVANNRLPAGTSFILCATNCVVAPKQLEEYKIHDDPPGLSGWLVEGRFIYDAFLLDSHKHCIYAQKGQTGLFELPVSVSVTGTDKYNVAINTLKSATGNKWYLHSAANAAALIGVTEGTAITTSSWHELTATNTAIATTGTYNFVTAGDTYVELCEVDSASKPVAYVKMAYPAIVAN